MIENIDLYFYRCDINSWLQHITEEDYIIYTAPNESFQVSMLNINERIFIQMFRDDDSVTKDLSLEEFKELSTKELVDLILEDIHIFTDHF